MPKFPAYSPSQIIKKLKRGGFVEIRQSSCSISQKRFTDWDMSVYFKNGGN